jgi:virulence-associated protein VagC
MKLARYQASGIAEVVRFDPEDVRAPLRVWDSIEGDLVERAPWSAALRECATLSSWWVVVSTDHGAVLRLARDREGQHLLLTPSEERFQLAEELARERKARMVAEQRTRENLEETLLIEQKTREIIEPTRQLTEEAILTERERNTATAETEKRRAEIARLRGER